MNFTCIVAGLAAIVAGVLFAFQKLLPKSWKALPDEQKAKVKIKPLCINIGTMISLCGAILLVRGFWQGFGGRPFSITMIAWFVACCWDIMFIAKSRRYKD